MQTLDTYRIRVELAKMDKNYTWLARRTGYTRSYISYIVKTRKLTIVDKIANALELPKDSLIVKGEPCQNIKS